MAGKNQGSAGRFGPRYGNTLRKKVSDIEKSSRGKHKCPFCGKEDKVRREAQQFFKSVCTYIKDSEYNQDFFSKFELSDEIKKYWKEKEFWQIWLMVR